jgi:hypothetical protein
VRGSVDKGPGRRPVGQCPLMEVSGRRPSTKVRVEGLRTKVQGEGPTRELIRVFKVRVGEEREPPLPSCFCIIYAPLTVAGHL